MKILPSLKQLEYLVALAETRHFGRAAALCNVTPSTLSAGIRDLETVLGVTLAERTKRTVLMTDIGVEIAARGRRLLRDAEDVMELADAHGSPLSGPLRLGVIPTIGPYLLPRVLPRLGADYPSLQLYLREEQTEPLLRHLRDGDIDLALIALPYDTGELAVQWLFDDPFLFACHPSHPLAVRDQVTEEDLVDQPLLLLEDGHCLRGHALDACRIVPSHLRVQFEATSLPTLVQMVAGRLGVTLLPRLTTDAPLSMGDDLTLVPMANVPSRQIGLAWRAASPRAREFETLADYFRSLD